jgi:preprotein translocase subunit SecG
VDILLLVLHVILSLGIITLVLLQKGAGATAGASFGGGGAGSVFGASGSANFLSKTTAILATCFFLNSTALAYLASHREVKNDSVLDVMTTPAPESNKPETEPLVPADKPAAGSDVPQAEVPAAAQVPSTEIDVPPAENVPVDNNDVPPADVPATETSKPAGK